MDQVGADPGKDSISFNQRPAAAFAFFPIASRHIVRKRGGGVGRRVQPVNRVGIAVSMATDWIHHLKRQDLPQEEERNPDYFSISSFQWSKGKPERRSHRTGRNHSNLLDLLLARNTIVHQLDVRFWGFSYSSFFSIFFILFEPFNEKKTPLFLLAGQDESIMYKLPLFFPLSLSLDITRPYMASLGPNTSRWLEPNGLEQTPPFEQTSNPVTSACCCRWRQRQGSYFFFPVQLYIYIFPLLIFFPFLFLVLIKDTWRGGIALTVGFFFFELSRLWKEEKKRKRNAWGGMGHPAHPRSACQVDRQGNMASWQARQKAIARETTRLEAILKNQKMTGTFRR